MYIYIYINNIYMYVCIVTSSYCRRAFQKVSLRIFKWKPLNKYGNAGQRIFLPKMALLSFIPQLTRTKKTWPRIKVLLHADCHAKIIHNPEINPMQTTFMSIYDW